MVEQWVRELAQQEEHRLWKEIVRFTRKAAHVAQLLLDDYERQLQARI